MRERGPGPTNHRRRGSQPAHQSPLPRLAGALDTSSCPQSRKNELFFKAQEAFGSTRTSAAYYDFMRPFLGETPPCVQTPVLQKPPLPSHHPPSSGGAPTEELQRLAQANVSMDIHTFTNLNPGVLQVGLGAVPGGGRQAGQPREP